MRCIVPAALPRCAHARSRLVAQHPSVLTEDVAARFVVGLGTADKAYTGLKNMVDWVRRNQGAANRGIAIAIRGLAIWAAASGPLQGAGATARHPLAAAAAGQRRAWRPAHACTPCWDAAHRPHQSAPAVRVRLPFPRPQVEAQGVADLVRQPQPRFQLIKQHYPQVRRLAGRCCPPLFAQAAAPGLGRRDAPPRAAAGCVHHAQQRYSACRRALHQGRPTQTLGSLSLPAPQGFYCWSTRSDCVLEVEATGRWREAYDALRAAGQQRLVPPVFCCRRRTAAPSLMATAIAVKMLAVTCGWACALLRAVCHPC